MSTSFSYEDEMNFAEGFYDAAPEVYNFDMDVQTSTPWCAPWTWADEKDWYVSGFTPYEMGARFAKKCAQEIEELA